MTKKKSALVWSAALLVLISALVFYNFTRPRLPPERIRPKTWIHLPNSPATRLWAISPASSWRTLA